MVLALRRGVWRIRVFWCSQVRNMVVLGESVVVISCSKEFRL